MKKRFVCIFGAALATAFLEPSVHAEMRMATTRLVLKGESNGGVLTLMQVPTYNYPYVAVTNRPGDPSTTVLERLAQELSASAACREYYGKAVMERTEDRLVLLGGDSLFRNGVWMESPSWIFGGTETGFKIPPAPVFLSATYESNKVVLRWVNKGVSDSLWVFLSTTFQQAVGVVPGTANEFVYKGQFQPPDFLGSSRSSDLRFMVVAVKDGTPSNGAGIALRNHFQQETSMNVPFSQGVATGFQSWTHNTVAGKLDFEQGNLPGVAPGSDLAKFDGKGFYQIIKGRGSVQGGVSRRFLGLVPGHTYRVSARLNTLETKEGNWSFSFHAAYNPASGDDLTPAQLAGLVALPKGASELAAGRIAEFTGKTTTGGQWITRSSANAGPNNSSGDIVLPEGVTSVTIWFRLMGTNVTEARVGIDSVTIEDLGR